MAGNQTPEVRLAELIASLSLATDLGLGQPQEHVLRQTVIATRLAAAAGMAPEHPAAAFYVSLLAWMGCVADSHELAHWFADDLQMRADSYQVDKAGPGMARFLLGHLAQGQPALQRITMVGRFLAQGVADMPKLFVSHCQTASDIADRLDLPPEVRTALLDAFERWDGKGVPGRARGTEIQPVMRVVHIADDAEAHHRAGGIEGALAMLRSRRGTEFDPELVDLCCSRPDEIFGGLDTVDAWGSVIRGCTPLDRTVPEAELTAVLRVFADYADLKSPWFLGYSRRVAELTAAAATAAGLGPDDVALAERAALVHRIGAIGVSTGIWNKPGPLTVAERERVRTVPYLTERVLCRQPRLCEIGAVAAAGYERMDGSGYPRGLTGTAIPAPARLLAAAAVYQALGEDRPHRTAFAPADRTAAMHAEVTDGRLDGAAVGAVLTAAGCRTTRRPRMVAGLTGRELEVLELLVRGSSNRQIAQHLSIAPRTVGTHVEHIYTKIGVSTRGAAAMFAMRHGLVSAAE
ncbi:HD domain-containing phosphohydrolase [Mycolicibacterium mucogenicum]|uniref:LuxR family transcriptional regulator n=1 Tax=Mycolicibacterium mucogenicum DSM 44124 TaxID=1226753 RepID=A0A8H2JEI3_MYCMU|nr:HD domain-containing phosphohydrolase [Mycolicibacterium mucogenicum]KAB7753200.1 LuxR family transcriptional regulator [Mycolicibacterium mucogenicum DSM 44124]QPG67185.1 LuxR family transcriptional regulator [Mycolicibacterium mucogenicum DSM 44124]